MLTNLVIWVQLRKRRRYIESPPLLDFGRQCFQALLKCLQIVAQLYGAHTSLLDHYAHFAQFVGHAHLSQCRILEGHLHDGVLYALLNAVLYHRLAARYLL